MLKNSPKRHFVHLGQAVIAENLLRESTRSNDHRTLKDIHSHECPLMLGLCYWFSGWHFLKQWCLTQDPWRAPPNSSVFPAEHRKEKFCRLDSKRVCRPATISFFCQYAISDHCREFALNCFLAHTGNTFCNVFYGE